MLPSFFTNDHLRLLFFGGKGGVGKTTSASASAVWLAGNHPAKKFLLISTDPAHSLADSFKIKKLEARSWNLENLASSFQLPALGNLFLCEFDAAHALSKFKKKYERQIKLITDRGTYFDNADINSFFNLSLPGIDEVMGVLEISELIEKHEYDTVIIDTAPTGHTLSMLKLPELLDKWLGVFDLMEGKHHLLQEHFARSISTDNADDFLRMMHDRLKMTSRLLRDPLETEFVVVTIPEEVVLAETLRLLHSLFELRIPVHNIIVNRVSKNERCPNCEKRGENQRPLLSKIEAISSYKKIIVPISPAEVQGVERLKIFASWLNGENLPTPPFVKGGNKGGFNNKKLSLSNLDHVNFILVCGKGGVGKTTTAAATALLLAERQPKLKYKLYSIDPAHSLSDCFKNPPRPPFLKGKERGIRILPNLDVYELDAQSLYTQFQSEYQDSIDDLFDQFSGGRERRMGTDFGYDRELLKELLATSPPGLEELMAMNKVISNFSLPLEERGGGDGKTDCIILDTAPTGHFIRFLELPGLVRSWLKAIFELLLKYRGTVRLNTVAEKLVLLSRNIRSVISAIADNNKSCAVVVTIPEAMAIAETERLVDAIGDHKIRCAGVVVNMATDDPAGCDFCGSRIASEAKEIKKAAGLCPNMALVPYVTRDIRGMESLAEFGKIVWE